MVERYALRMRIEEAFRDLKSTRFSLSLELHRAYQVESQGQGPALLGAPRMQRLQILLLIATLSLIVAWLLGKAIELIGQHRHYQANTVRDPVVRSTIFVGLKITDDPRVLLRLPDLLAAIKALE